MKKAKDVEGAAFYNLTLKNLGFLVYDDRPDESENIFGILY